MLQGMENSPSRLDVKIPKRKGLRRSELKHHKKEFEDILKDETLKQQCEMVLMNCKTML